MAKHAEIVKFEAAVDKAAVAWVAAVNKLIDQLHDNALASSESLRDKVAAIPVPKGAPDKEFAALESSINDTIAKRGSGLKITVKFKVVVDAKAKSLDLRGIEMRYPSLN